MGNVERAVVETQSRFLPDPCIGVSEAPGASDSARLGIAVDGSRLPTLTDVKAGERY